MGVSRVKSGGRGTGPREKSAAGLAVVRREAPRPRKQQRPTASQRAFSINPATAHPWKQYPTHAEKVAASTSGESWWMLPEFQDRAAFQQRAMTLHPDSDPRATRGWGST